MKEALIDILETGKARGLSFNSWLHKDRHSGWTKQEVNIRDHIDKEDIVGAWEIKDGLLNWHENPEYQPDAALNTSLRKKA